MKDVLNEITVFGRLLGVQEVTFSPSICGMRRGRVGRARKERGGEEGATEKRAVRRSERGGIRGGKARWRVSPAERLDRSWQGLTLFTIALVARKLINHGKD